MLFNEMLRIMKFMKIKTIVLIVLLCSTFISLEAVVISGKIINQITKMPLSGAQIKIIELSKETTSDSNGYFSISTDSTSIVSGYSTMNSFDKVTLSRGVLSFTLNKNYEELNIGLLNLKGVKLNSITIKDYNNRRVSVNILPEVIPVGVYFITISSGNTISSYKFIWTKQNSKSILGLMKNSGNNNEIYSSSPINRSDRQSHKLSISKSGYMDKNIEIENANIDVNTGDIALKPTDYKWHIAKIYNWDDYDGNPSALITKCEENDINTIQIMDRYFIEGSNVNLDLVTLANAKGIKVFIIFQTFFNDNEEVTQSNSALDVDGDPVSEEWLTFLCPNEESYKSRRLSEIEQLVSDIEPDGISMDFFRYFVFWESGSSSSLVQTCFCHRCVDKFCTDYSLNVEPAEIISNYLEEWTEFKCNTIEDYTSRISSAVKTIKPDIMMNLHMVPWTQAQFNGAIEEYLAQDIIKLSKWFDIFQPMTYSTIMNENISWITEVASDAKSILPSSYVVPCIQSVDGSDSNLQSISQSPVNGYTIWPFEDY